MDRLDRIVEQAIAYTKQVLRAAPSHASPARAGLERMLRDLGAGAPDHPALARLRAFLEQLDLRLGRTLH